MSAPRKENALRRDPVYKAAYDRAWRAKNAERVKAYDKARRSSEKQRAARTVRNRILRGTMERLPCEICGDPKTHAHHEDYSKPLDVRWLCPKHHKEAHGHE